jgi:hypothetical protein
VPRWQPLLSHSGCSSLRCHGCCRRVQVLPAPWPSHCQPISMVAFTLSVCLRWQALVIHTQGLSTCSHQPRSVSRKGQPYQYSAHYDRCSMSAGTNAIPQGVGVGTTRRMQYTHRSTSCICTAPSGAPTLAGTVCCSRHGPAPKNSASGPCRKASLPLPPTPQLCKQHPPAAAECLQHHATSQYHCSPLA